MTRMKFVAFVALLAGLLGLLAACGGDTPTATPAPTTAPVVATVAATNTTAPAPATATTAPTTDTGASGAGSATETPAAAGGGTAPTTADEQLIQESYTATRTLKSYHFTLSATGDVFTQPVQLEGDYVAPDKVHAKGTFNGGQGEMLKVGAKAYKKDASGAWVPDPTNDTTSGNPADITSDANVVESLGPFLEAGSNFKKSGDESMDGVSVSHFTGDVDAGKMSGGAAVPGMPSLGTTSLWIDPQTKFLHKLSMDVDLGAAFRAMSDMAQALAGTPTPGGETATPIPSMKFKVEMTISKQNDPSLSVPTP